MTPLLEVLSGVVSALETIVDQLLGLLNLNGLSEPIVSLIDSLLDAVSALLGHILTAINGLLSEVSGDGGVIGKLLSDLQQEVQGLLNRIQLKNPSLTTLPSAV